MEPSGVPTLVLSDEANNEAKSELQHEKSEEHKGIKTLNTRIPQTTR